MATHNLTVSARSETGKEAAKRLRHAGQVPAVAYGHKEEPVKLSVNAKELRDLLSHHAARGLLNLKFSDGSPDLPVIIKDLQRHPVKHSVNSVDFLRVSLDEEVTATVPVVLHGEPVGVKQDGGVLVQGLHEIAIAALPQNLPEEIEADVSALEFEGEALHVRDLNLPAGVRLLTSADEAVAAVNAPRIEPVEEVAEEPAADAVPTVGETEGEEES